MPGSKPGALPLGDTPSLPRSIVKKLVSPEGFEPATHGLEGRCSIQLSYEPVKSCLSLQHRQLELERMMRIELTPSAWKAEVLPLNYIRIKNWSGRRDSNSRPSPWQGDALPLSHFRIIGRGRWIRTIESSANGFTVRPLWPLGNPSINKYWSWWRESNPQPADYKSAALPLSHTSESLKKLATWNGLEPSTSSVTGWHSNQLNYRPMVDVIGLEPMTLCL